jgi:chromosome segregation ATPase
VGQEPGDLQGGVLPLGVGMFNTLSTKKAHTRISELEERLERLEKKYKDLSLEWENAYDKLKTMMGRVAKRAEAMHDAAEDNGQLHPEELPADPAIPGWSALTPRQKQAQLQIMRRRAGLGGR